MKLPRTHEGEKFLIKQLLRDDAECRIRITEDEELISIWFGSHWVVDLVTKGEIKTFHSLVEKRIIQRMGTAAWLSQIGRNVATARKIHA